MIAGGSMRGLCMDDVDDQLAEAFRDIQNGAQKMYRRLYDIGEGAGHPDSQSEAIRGLELAFERVIRKITMRPPDDNKTH
jgi:hypothetical protein